MLQFGRNPFQSRQTWPAKVLRPSPALHGEKFAPLPEIRLVEGGSVKTEFLDHKEDCRYYADSNHRSSHLLPNRDNSTPKTVKSQLHRWLTDDVSSVTQSATAQNCAILNSPKELKLEMEVFGDLDSFCQSQPNSPEDSMAVLQNIVDELSTPVFDKAVFDYDRHSPSSDLLSVATSAEDQTTLSLNNEISNNDIVNIDDNPMINHDSIIDFKIAENNTDSVNVMSSNEDYKANYPKLEGYELVDYIVINGQGLINNNTFHSSNLTANQYDTLPDGNELANFKNRLILDDEDFLPTVNSYSEILFEKEKFVTSSSIKETSNDSLPQSVTPSFYVVQQPETPYEASESSRSSFEHSHKPTLNLKINSNYIDPINIETPEIISTLEAIEKDKEFNIFNFVNDESSTVPSTTVVKKEPNENSVVKKSVTIVPPQQTSKRKRNLKRNKCADDDDEDYLPPISLLPSKRQRLNVHLSSDYSDSENEDETRSVRRKQNRRPSTSSSTSNVDTSRYREMRDKNNEASRRSRLKRKTKELAIEDQALELEERNIKLKARVSELKTTVDNFRKNVMRLMLAKK